VLKKFAKRLLANQGLTLVRTSALPPEIPPDLEAGDIDIFREVEHYTMTSVERITALVQAVKYIVSAGIDGAVVECGVWRGGSMMAVSKTLLNLGVCDRDLFLFDTFEGMPAPQSDEMDYLGRSGIKLLEEAKRLPYRGQLDSFLLAFAPLEQVRNNVLRTAYPNERIHFVKGKVEHTIPAEAPSKISLLRLDTDWYESTKHELVHLFPRVSSGGVVIFDDYGHWSGARRAVDEYLQQQGLNLLLNRIDYTGRIAIKP
jgi:O-methyltransferase